MRLSGLNAMEWKQFKTSVDVFHSEKDTTTRFYNNIKNSLRASKPSNQITGPFGKILEVAPFTFAKDFNTQNGAFEDLCIYKALREFFKSKGINRTQQFQYPNHLMGYMTLDNKSWHNIIQFEKIMQGETDQMQYRGCLINPKEFLKSIKISDQKAILKRAGEIAKELKSDQLISSQIQSEVDSVSGDIRFILPNGTHNIGPKKL